MIAAWRRRSGACLVLFVTAAAACGNGRESFREEPRPGPLAEKPETSADAGCAENAVRCSRDLRAVVDACDESRVVTACPPEQGCAEGRCVPACDAAVSRGASVGCEFAAIKPAYYAERSGSCFAAFIANTWATPVRLEAEYAGASLDLRTSARVVRSSGAKATYEPFTGELQPDEVAILFLEHSFQPDIPCPVGITPAKILDSGIEGTGRGSSYRITSSAPVSAYSIYPFGGG